MVKAAGGVGGPQLAAKGKSQVGAVFARAGVLEARQIAPTKAVGRKVYVASGITKMGITELTVAVWPWLLTMLGFLVLVTYWPPLSIWLPKTIGY